MTLTTKKRKPFSEEVIHPIAPIDPHIAAFHDPGSNTSDQYRTVFARLLASPHPPHFIVITSSTSKEGRSIATLNLAVTIAKETGKKVLVVDCDFPHPSLHNYLKLPFERGLLDVIQGKADLTGSIKETIIPNLFLLTSGQVLEHLFGIFSSRELKLAIEKLKENFEYILLDSPALDNYPDACLLGQLVDGALLIIRSEYTQREAVERAKFKLENLKVNILGSILTRYKYHIPSFIYNLV